MNIIKLKLINFKGESTEIELTGRDLFTGPHASGKSKVQQALEFVLTGKISEFKSSTNDNLFKLSSVQDANLRPKVGVRLYTDEGFEFERVIEKYITKKQDGSRPVSYKQHLDCKPLLDETKQSDFEKRLFKELDPKEIMFSLKSFYEMTATEKKRFIMRMTNFNYDEWTVDKIKDYLTEHMLTSDILVNDPKMYNDYKESINEIVAEYSQKLSFEENCQSLVSIAISKESKWRNEKKKAIAASQKLTEIKNRRDETTRGLEDAKQSLRENEQYLRELRDQRIINQNNITANNALVLSVEELETRILDKQQEVNPLNADDIQKEIESFNLSMPVLKEVNQPIGLDDLVKEKNNLESKVESNEQKINEKLSEIEFKRDELEEQEDILGKHKFDICELKNKISDKENMIAKFSEGNCPLMEGVKCTTDFTDIIEVFKTQIINLENDIQSIGELVKCAETSINNLSEKITKLDGELGVLENTRTELNAKLENYVNRIDDIMNKYDTDVRNAQKTYNQAIYAREENLKLVANLKEKLNECNSFEERKQAAINTLKESLEELKSKQLADVKEDSEFDELINPTLETIEDLKTTINSKEDALKDLVNQQEAIVDVKKAENWFFAYSQIKRLLGVEGVLGIILKQGLDPIKEHITKVLNVLGKDVEFYFDTSGTGKKAVFDYGWIPSDGIKRSFDTLSRGENLILSTAMIVSFTHSIDDLKHTVLLVDNLNDLDAQAIEKYVSGLNELNYDNILVSGIISDRIDSGDQFKGFKVNRY